MTVSAPATTSLNSGNLPAELTSYVGRRAALARFRGLVSSARCLTITGPGGIGKTRLALQLGAAVRRAFNGDVWIVEYRSLTDGGLVGRLIAETLGIRDQTPDPPLTALVEHLAARPVMLILDSCEHLLSDIAELACELLIRCPELQLVATSRSPLGIPGEHIVQALPLDTPPSDTPSTTEASMRYDAVKLFVERAKAADADFALTDANVDQVVFLCRRLAGMPLAIEMAAAQVRAVPLNQIVHLLGDKLYFLSGTNRAATWARQRTLRSTLDYSYELCSADERTMWAWLSVFAGGGFDLSAAQIICVNDQIKQSQVIGLVAALVNKSIVLRVGDRYTILGPIHEYGTGLLRDSGDEAWLRQRHAEWCRDIARQAADEWQGANQLQWVSRLQYERDNIRAALSYAMSESRQDGVALQILIDLLMYWASVFGSFSDAREKFARALALDTRPTPVRAKALAIAAWFALRQADLDNATELLVESHALAEQLNDASALASCVHFAGLLRYFRDDAPRAVELLTDAHSRYAGLGDEAGAWMTLAHLTMATGTAGDHVASDTYGHQCLTAASNNSLLLSLSSALWAWAYGQWIQIGDLARIAKLATDSLRIMRQANDRWGVAECLEVLAWLAAAKRDDQRAARLLGAAQHTWQSIGAASPGIRPLVTPHDQCATALRERLGADAYNAAFNDGRVNDRRINEIIDTVTSSQKQSRRSVTEHAKTPRLTKRESEVAQHIARGLTNKAIAARLFVSVRTIDGHVQSTLEKLGATNRAEIAAWISRNTDTQ